MWGWKIKYHDLEASKERQKKYYDDLLTTNQQRENALQKRLFDSEERCRGLESDINTFEAQVSYLYGIIGKMRQILGVDDIEETKEASSEDADSSDLPPSE